MINTNLDKISKLIKKNKIQEASLELSKLGSEFFENYEYLYLRSKIFYLDKLYYLAVDTLLIALEFSQDAKIYNLLSEIYGVLGNKELSDKLADPKFNFETVNSLKGELSGIYRK
tara:strand:+ start:615 stop:959 length:345 start_codon:yes stop_codon:yes gene_type:complete